MKTILALRGRGNSGKSTAIRILHGLLIQNGFMEIAGNFSENYVDYWTVFERNGKKLGVTSSGDNYEILKRKLDILNQQGCSVIVCACRSFGYTNELLESKVGFRVEYIEKAISNKSQESNANNSDAQILLRRILQLM